MSLTEYNSIKKKNKQKLLFYVNIRSRKILLYFIPLFSYLNFQFVGPSTKIK